MRPKCFPLVKFGAHTQAVGTLCPNRSKGICVRMECTRYFVAVRHVSRLVKIPGLEYNGIGLLHYGMQHIYPGHESE